MANLRAIRKRIGSVRNTQQITRAMKMVSGAKFRRAEERIKGFRPYQAQLAGSALSLLARNEGLSHPLLQSGVTQAPPLFVLVTSDRGLCGGFNASVLKRVFRYFEENHIDPKQAVFFAIGRKATDYIKRYRWTTLGQFAPIPEPPSHKHVAEISKTLQDAFLTGAVGSITLVYNHFLNALTQQIRVEGYLPLELPVTKQKTQIDFLTEPDPQTLLDQILPQMLQTKLESVLLDSLAGEHGARMMAMDSASKNASEVIQKLKLKYNRGRQAAITSELLDIINGKNAIE